MTKEGIIVININEFEYTDFELNTVLGVDKYKAQIFSGCKEYKILKPGEEDRLRRLQAFQFCSKKLKERKRITSDQLKHLLLTFEIVTRGIIKDWAKEK